MCGICGIIHYRPSEIEDILKGMVSAIHHRGPDDLGYHVCRGNNFTLGLGQSRLSILDLSPAGHQPMTYNEFTLVLNGEIYNFKEIRKDLELKGHLFVSQSDTEVVLHAFAEWGISCLKQFIGMFAFVIFDRKKNEVYLVRDRSGIKPLYYYESGDTFLFGSELKSFHQFHGFNKDLNPDAVHSYFRFGFIPAPTCIYRHCRKLQAGHFLHYRLDKREAVIQKYWDVFDYYRMQLLDISYEDASIELEKILRSAFEYRMISDVPVGIFLSGGYDSTLVTSILQQNRSARLKTFTIGFFDGQNEAPNAKAIAGYLGTVHTEYYCSALEAQEIVPDLPGCFDEPFGDASAIPTILVSRLARKQVKVALSADAGDEIFGGYVNHATFIKNMQQIKAVPAILRNPARMLAQVLSFVWPDQSGRYKTHILSQILKLPPETLPQKLLESYYVTELPQKTSLFSFIPSGVKTVYDDDLSGFNDILSVALASDYVHYLQDDILTKVDRATMSVSLEGREPLLDHRIIEFAARLPATYKFGHTQKRILKDMVHRLVPENLMQSRKTGFSPPIHDWLKGDLSWLIHEYLAPEAISKSGLFNVSFVEKAKKDYINNRLLDKSMIWKLLMFQMWAKKWG